MCDDIDMNTNIFKSNKKNVEFNVMKGVTLSRNRNADNRKTCVTSQP